MAEASLILLGYIAAMVTVLVFKKPTGEVPQSIIDKLNKIISDIKQTI